MTGEGENVVMRVKVLDIENNNAVLFDQTSIDTPDADDFQTGADSPAAPFLGKPGNFVLLLYHNDGHHCDKAEGQNYPVYLRREQLVNQHLFESHPHPVCLWKFDQTKLHYCFQYQAP